jgi:aminopeptidase N
MLESYMGIEDLRQGLKIYLNKHKFKNAVTKDLWEALAAATNNTKDIEVKTLISPISETIRFLSCTLA